MDSVTQIRVYRAAIGQMYKAYAIVQEYYEVAAVVVRENPSEFASEYFVDGGGVWLAEDESGVVGCIALRALSSKPDCGEIKRLYVREDYRGRGLADRLLETLETYAKDFGFRWLYLDTAAEMKAAARFYKRKGFQACERYNDNPQAAIFMRKSLA